MPLELGVLWESDREVVRRWVWLLSGGEVPFYSSTEAALKHGQRSTGSTAQRAIGMAEVVGRCAAPWRSSRASWFSEWRARMVGKVA